jgi:TIR domain
MPRVFISYRQSDARQDAENLFKALGRLVGREEVFLDKFGIHPGAEFPDRITESLHDSDIVVIVIGPSWLRAKRQSGEKRLADADDWVRREIHLALRLKIPVVPVLVRGARMPTPTDLPPLLRRLSLKQAIVAAGRKTGDVARQITSQLPRVSVEFQLDDDDNPDYEEEEDDDGSTYPCYWINVSVQNVPRWVKSIRYKLSEEHTPRFCKPENPAETTTYGDFEVVATMHDNTPGRAERSRSVGPVLVSEALRATYGHDSSAKIRGAIRTIAAA